MSKISILVFLMFMPIMLLASNSEVGDILAKAIGFFILSVVWYFFKSLFRKKDTSKKKDG